MTKPTADLQYIQPIMLQPGYDTETNIYGLGYSPDNGVHFYVTYTTFGAKYRQEDADRLWKYLQGFVTKQIHDAVSLTWDNIKGKPDVVLRSDLPDFNQFALKKDLPAPVDLSGYAKTDAVEAAKATAESALSNAEKAQAIADTNSKLLETKVDRKDLPTVPTDLVHSAELDQVRTDVSQAQQDAAQAMANAKSAKAAIDTSDEFTVKKPSEYSEGFSHELKRVAVVIPDRSDLIESAQAGTIGILSTVSYGGYAHQALKVLDSQRPMTFIRNGSVDTWYPWETVTTTITVD